MIGAVTNVGFGPLTPPEGVTGTLTNVADTAVLPISGTQWATGKLVVGAGFLGTIVPEISIDGGVNWLAAAYSKRLDAVSANPTVQATLTSVTPSTWEIPLPANVTHLRARLSAVTTPGPVTLSGSLPYVPGVPVTAVLWDTTAAFGVAINTTTLDASGWQSAEFMFVNGDTGGVSRNLNVSPINSAGASVGGTNGGLGMTVNTGQTVVAGMGGPSSGGATAAYNGAFTPFLTKRFQAAVTAGTATGGSTELIIEVRR